MSTKEHLLTKFWNIVAKVDDGQMTVRCKYYRPVINRYMEKMWKKVLPSIRDFKIDTWVSTSTGNIYMDANFHVGDNRYSTRIGMTLYEDRLRVTPNANLKSYEFSVTKGDAAIEQFFRGISREAFR